ncbi:hypothetical protein B5V88_16595 [Heyndrickxia sporothermodurans]|nr:DUF3388 domain-containing protein [Heyndrickxia sporothermodurans]MBL5854864.1 DUF3388 domain-containing protein [Heyndrickxia sporothermodurans]PTY73844.1 hypothetical protein B5V88_16595 [Heyndrickxia sporothermodurans]
MKLTQLIKDEYSSDNIFILDGIVSTQRADERHWQLVREIMRLSAVKVIEHPDVFVQNTEYSLEDFDYIIELRDIPNQEITYEVIENNNFFSGSGFGGFDY